MQRSRNCKICGNEAIHSCRTISVLLQKQNNVVQSSEIVIGSGISARNLSEASINYNLAFSYLNYRLYDMHGNKIPPQLVTQVGDAFMRILQEVQILEVLSQNGWYYVSCTRCSKKLDRSAASLRCNQCVNHNVTNVVKYHVELLVDDGNNYATFVVFDKEMLKLAKQDAAALLLDEVNSGVGKKLKAELGRTDLDFHIRVTPHNFSPDHCTFTVSAASDSFNTESCNINETPFVEGKCGDASTSASASNTSTADVKGGRIHPRE
ncbi:hypothetical protein Bca101_030886 [Brassica carinata]